MAWAPGKALYMRVTPSSLDRALRIMEAVLRGLAAMNLKLGFEEDPWAKGTAVTIGSERVHFFIEEKIRQVGHVLTPKEEDLRRLTVSPREKWDFLPTEMLTLKITNFYKEIRNVLTD
jgi:hypothetical protein